MGVCLTWFAIRGKTPETVRFEIGLEKTGKTLDSPWKDIVGAELRSGWYLIQRSRYECRKDDIPRQLSVDCEVISLFVEEHVMFARAECWQNGNRIWSVVHSSEKADNHLESDGVLPAEYPSICENIAAKKGQTSFFEIPCAIAASLTGYRYDGPLNERPIFEVLALPPWWHRLTVSYPSLFWPKIL